MQFSLFSDEILRWHVLILCESQVMDASSKAI